MLTILMPRGCLAMKPKFLTGSKEMRMLFHTRWLVLSWLGGFVFSIFPLAAMELEFPPALSFGKELFANDEVHDADGLCPIGWSKDGKFAYLMEPASEDSGSNHLMLVIQDMVTDKVVFNESWEADFDQNKSTRDIFQDQRYKIAAKLNEYGIVPQSGIRLAPLEFNYRGNSYSFRLTRNFKDFSENENGIGSLSLRVISPQLGEKTILKVSFEYRFVLDAGIAGCIVSPVEPRVAVVVAEKKRGWEGPPHVLGFRLVGCHLTSMFKKRTN
jgi:hypothetical protein